MLQIEMMSACIAKSSGVGVRWNRDANWESCRVIRSGGTSGCVSRILS